MQADFFFATLFNLAMNLIYTVVALIIGFAALKFDFCAFCGYINVEPQKCIII